MNTATHNDIVKNIQGSFAVENITLSKKSLSNLEHLSNGSIDIENLVNEIKDKYIEVMYE